MKTPYFLVHKDKIDIQLNKLKQALNKYWPNSIIGYSYKTNSLPWLISYMQKQACFAEVVSDHEYYLARAINYPINNIIYNGPIKSKESFIEAVSQGAIVNLDAKRELDWLKELDKNKSYKIGLRANCDLETVCKGETTAGNEGIRFGFCFENNELYEAMSEVAKHKNIKLAGLHLHTSSKTRGLNVYKAIADYAVKIIECYSLNLEYIDIGGGFFGDMPNKPEFKNYISIVSEILQKHVDKNTTTLIVEPGMSIIGPCVDYITSVIDTKVTNYDRFVVTDGSRIAVDPFMRKSSYSYSIEYKANIKEIYHHQTVVGFTCMEDDRLFKVENTQIINVYDRIIYHKVGAYTMCLNPLFIKYFPAVYLKQGENISEIRSEWGINEYLQKSKWGNE